MSVTTKELRFPSSDGLNSVFVRVWEKDGARPKFILQIAHGMCEYADRYACFAQYACEHGAVVFGNDHLGHGHTVKEGGTYGYFAKKDGYQRVIEDMHTLTELAKKEYPGLPLVLMGHSMGSVLARLYTARYPDEVAAAVWTGTSGANNLTGLIRFLSGVGKFFGRGKKEATLLSYLAFNKYNDKIPDAQSPNAWLTRDTEVVKAYDADPWCTFKFTDSAACDMANIIDGASGAQWAEKLPKGLPCLLASGEMDPVGNYGAGVKDVAGWARGAGLTDVTLKMYPQMRHEILNEIGKEEVYRDILEWIGQRVS